MFLHRTLFLEGKATHLSDHVPYELGVLGEAPGIVAVAWLAHVLGHLVALVEVNSIGIVQSPGCCSSVAAAVSRRAVLCPFLNWLCLSLVV